MTRLRESSCGAFIPSPGTTGNGGPWDRNWRSPGGGDNLYLSSIVALHADTGKFAWYFQETPGDQWDYTASQDMILADVKINGKLRKVIMQAPQNGFFYVFDRENGKFISAVPFAYVTWVRESILRPAAPLKHPAPATMRKESFYPRRMGVRITGKPCPSTPARVLRIFPRPTPPFYKEDVSHCIAGPGVIKRGLSLDPMVPVGEQKLTPPPADRPKGSFLLAWNPATQKEAWRFPNVNGSTMTTAGNLVFSSSIDGHFMAFSADKGEQLWQAQLVPGFGSPITYSLDGKQYVSVLAGRSGHGRLYTFALGANLAIPAPAANSRPLTTAAATGKTTQNGVQRCAGDARTGPVCAKVRGMPHGRSQWQR
jgi:quinohemoprotein ethanol dehydrogenase